MHHIVIQVSQESSFWTNFFDILQRLVQSEMCRVRFDPDTIQNQDVEILQSGDRVGRDEIQIGRVGEVIEPVCDDREFAVNDFKRGDLKLTTYAERCVGINNMRNQLRQSAADVCRLKNILKDPAKIGPRDLVRVYTHCTITKIQRPNII